MLLLLACHATLPPGESAAIPAPVRVSEGGQVTCADPGARDQAPFEPFSTQPGAGDSDRFETGDVGGGVAAADFDGDGLIDLALPGEDSVALWRATAPGVWEDATAELLPREILGFFSAAVAVDYDGDGDLDIHLVSMGGGDRLLANDGGGAFTDVTAQAGIGGGFEDIGMSAAWADVDGDGDLDAFVANYGQPPDAGVGLEDLLSGGFPPGEPSYLYLNRGDGSFEIAPDSFPEAVSEGYSFQAAWVDLDLDGAPELYLLDDYGAMTWPNALLWNREGRLEPDGGAAGLGLGIFAMGLGIGDLNGDLVPDLLVSDWSRLWLMLSTGTGWVDAAAARGLVPSGDQVIAWGSELGDVDDDGDLDAVVGFGELQLSPEITADLEQELGLRDPEKQPDAIFLQDASGGFEDVAPAWGMDQDGVSRGFVLADLDGDGWLDIVKRDMRGATRSFRARCGSAAWLEIAPRQPGPNPFAIGARVSVTAAGRTQVRQLRAGGTSLHSGGPPELHFGLGEAESAEVEITWPDGAVSRVADLAARQRVVVERL